MARKPNFSISENVDGLFNLTSSDFDPYQLVFQKYGRDGGGYDWESVAIELIRLHHAKLSKKISFDSEASMFCALADNEAALLQLETAMQKIFTSQKRLASLIKSANDFEHEDSSECEEFKFVVLIYFGEYLHDQFESLFELVDSKFDSMDSEVSGSMGAGETKIFIKTNSYKKAVRSIKPILNQFELLNPSKIGYRTTSETSYELVWPPNEKKTFEPKIDF